MPLIGQMEISYYLLSNLYMLCYIYTVLVKNLFWRLGVQRQKTLFTTTEVVTATHVLGNTVCVVHTSAEPVMAPA